MRLAAKGLVLLGFVAIAGLAVASEEVIETSPYLIASSRVVPSYPPAAQAARWGGTVVLAAEVKADGSVGKIEVIDSSHPNLGFEESAMSAMKQWRFEPATSEGEAIGAVSVFRLAFEIPGTPSRNFPSVYGEQLVSRVMPTNLDSLSGYMGDSYRTRQTPAQGRVLKMGRPPVMREGALYDRRDLFPEPPSGQYQPNRHKF